MWHRGDERRCRARSLERSAGGTPGGELLNKFQTDYRYYALLGAVLNLDETSAQRIECYRLDRMHGIISSPCSLRKTEKPYRHTNIHFRQAQHAHDPHRHCPKEEVWWQEKSDSQEVNANRGAKLVPKHPDTG